MLQIFIQTSNNRFFSLRRTARKMKFSINHFFSKCLEENFVFSAESYLRDLPGKSSLKTLLRQNKNGNFIKVFLIHLHLFLNFYFKLCSHKTSAEFLNRFRQKKTFHKTHAVELCFNDATSC